jgi:hypothetical protein
MLGCRGWVGALMVLLGSHVGLVEWVETLRWVGGKFVHRFFCAVYFWVLEGAVSSGFWFHFVVVILVFISPS